MIKKVQQPHFTRSNLKGGPKCVGEMTDSDNSKSIRALARDMGVSEFLIGQVAQEDNPYFSCKIKESIFISDHVQQEENCIFNKLKDPIQPSIHSFFSDENNICQD